ncbi:hypothetical protein UFOVP29_120 [uncultured Caudovirales phage]|uniref:Uncharacterized protein n=1 Tax=uncultured Caudovirales phage TaxID=2100421 RepID=A0A6J5KMF2_9CAUD|nr:hypothetical protein UFOVP29_120 [uncultured Caudovirales phage]
MATRSRIGIRNSDDSVDSIYCHWDGYPENNGLILVEHYTAEDKIRELMSLGDLSSLGREIGQKHDFDKPANKDWCLAYGRDRSDEHCDARHSNTVQEFLDIDCGAEYYYIFHYGRWMVYPNKHIKWVLVTDVLDQSM